jgi:hypothetical protein
VNSSSRHLRVQLDNDHSEDHTAGTRSIIKNYNAPPFQSPVLFETVYSKALKQAGWQVIRESHSADATVTAHYAAGDRDLWACLHGGGGDYSIQVADEGDLAAHSIAIAMSPSRHSVRFRQIHHPRRFRTRPPKGPRNPECPARFET